MLLPSYIGFESSRFPSAGCINCFKYGIFVGIFQRYPSVLTPEDHFLAHGRTGSILQVISHMPATWRLVRGIPKVAQRLSIYTHTESHRSRGRPCFVANYHRYGKPPPFCLKACLKCSPLMLWSSQGFFTVSDEASSCP